MAQGFQLDDYVATSRMVHYHGQWTKKGVKGHVQHIQRGNCAAMDMDEDDFDENGPKYIDWLEVGRQDTSSFDDWDIEYTLRLDDGQIIVALQRDIKRAVHPIERKQLTLLECV